MACAARSPEGEETRGAPPLAREIASDGGGAVVTGAGWSFGECLGACRADLTIQADRLRLVVSDNYDLTHADNQGRLTPAAAARLAAAAAGVDTSERDKVYGCPDCDDAGAFYVTLEGDGTPSKHTYPYRSPPEALAAVDGSARALIEALWTCTAGQDVVPDEGCSPLREPRP